MSPYADLLARLKRDPKRWLVTGAAGFIGSALTETLLGHGQHVVGLDNLSTGHRRNVDDAVAATKDSKPRFSFIEGDIRDEPTVSRACDGIDFVLHQAALGSVPRSMNDPFSSHDSNVSGFLRMLVAARDAKVQRFVYASSSSVYGDDPTLPKVEGKEGAPLSPYAATKRINETYAKTFQSCYGLQTIGLRYFNVFGRRQDPNGPYAAVIPRWLDDLRNDRQCKIFGDGTNSRDFCYVDNAVQANILAATTDAAPLVYNVGCGGRTDLNTLHRLLRTNAATYHPPAGSATPTYEDPRPGDVPHSQADIGSIEANLLYAPTHDVSAGLKETVDWFLGHQG